jgi:hypothetical protein
MRSFLLLFALIALANSGDAQSTNCASPPSTLSAVELATQISNLEQQLASASRGGDFFTIAACLPSSWKVNEQGTELSVSTQRIKDEIAETAGAIDPAKRQEKLTGLLNRLRVMREQLSAYSNAPYQNERTKAAEILARREFDKLSSPGLMARIQDWINRQIRDFFTAFFQVLPDTTPYFRIAGWTLVLLAFALVMRALLKLLWDDRAHVKFDATSGHVSATHWTDWLASARAAAELGDWREAIRFTYWGAVSHLEQQGCWTSDRARTPREYLRLLKDTGERRSLLTDVTRKFERAWYAQRSATELEYRELLSNVEALGCR